MNNRSRADLRSGKKKQPMSGKENPMPVFITEYRFKADAGNWKTGVGNCKTDAGFYYGVPF